MRLPQELDNNRSHSASYGRYVSDRSVDYSEYMWMADEMEEFDRKCLEQLMEDEFIEDCFEEMLAEEDELYELMDTISELREGGELDQADLEFIVEFLQSLPFSAEIDLNTSNIVGVLTRDTKLNPEAPEFIPGEVTISCLLTHRHPEESDLDPGLGER